KLKEEAKKKKDSEAEEEEEKDEAEKKKDSEEDDGFKADEYKIKILFKKDIPEGVAVIRNARILTMKDRQIIENGDILIKNNRIAAVGPAGSLQVPRGATEIDASGKT
ncbi:hypothetical protein, partial [Salinimicrobium oceani]